MSNSLQEEQIGGKSFARARAGVENQMYKKAFASRGAAWHFWRERCVGFVAECTGVQKERRELGAHPALVLPLELFGKRRASRLVIVSQGPSRGANCKLQLGGSECSECSFAPLMQIGGGAKLKKGEEPEWNAPRIIVETGRRGLQWGRETES